MAKYIDADKLLSEIERRKVPFKKDIEDGVYPTYLCALMDFEDLIDSLQQERPKADLEKEEYVGVAESPLKTFQRVNEFEEGASYRH